MQSLPPTVWRGVGFSSALVSKYKRNIGKTIYFYSFTSTSRSKEQASAGHFASTTLLKINLQSGFRHAVADVSKVSDMPWEQEVLLSPNSGFRIEKVSMDQHPMLIELTLVDQSQCIEEQRPSPWE